MNGRSRIAVAELSRQENNSQSLGGYGFQERAALRRYCLLLFSTGSPWDTVESNSRLRAYSSVANGK